ncbi:MAG: hypothetical protein P4L53_12235 [Candidatus Obscuribacterales bacterium]|nr:hypothetical protein [Candidatus Obscuribacterales bacterium]
MVYGNSLKRLFFISLAGGFIAWLASVFYVYFLTYLGFCYTLSDRIEFLATDKPEILAQARILKVEFGKILALKVLIDFNPYTFYLGALVALGSEYFLRVRNAALKS